MKFNQKHLTLSDRILIEQGLNEGKSFKVIASIIGKDPTTASKEVKKHRAIKQHKDTNKKPRCANEKTCLVNGLCSRQRCFKLCKSCKLCRDICPQYKPKECGRLHKPLTSATHVVAFVVASIIGGFMLLSLQMIYIVNVCYEKTG